jgi:hypothetical protein
MTMRFGNRRHSSGSSGLAGRRSRGKDCHSQSEDTEELHYDCKGSVGSDLSVDWSRLVMVRCGVLDVISEGPFEVFILLVVQIV